MEQVRLSIDALCEAADGDISGRMATFPVQASRVGTEALIEIVNVDFSL